MQHFLYKIYIFFCLITVSILFSQCQGGDLTKDPLPTSFVLNIEEGNQGPGEFSFDSGFMLLASFSISGERNDADDFEFVRNFDGGLPVTFSAIDIEDELIFELPKGEYERVEISFSTLALNEQTNIEVKGLYEFNNPNKEPVDIWLEVDEGKDFVFELKKNEMPEALSSVESEELTIELSFNPYHWFKPVTIGAMSNANVTAVNNRQTVRVNKNDNNNIHGIIVPRIGEDRAININ